MLHELNEKGQCPVCKKKPITYKTTRGVPFPQYFCCRCHRAYDLTTKKQRENWAYDSKGNKKD
jgi:transposase-like protein